MGIGISKREISGVKLFDLNPKFFDRRLENRSHLRRVTERQIAEYLGNLSCVLCGQNGGGCGSDCGKGFHIPQIDSERKKKGK